MPLRTGVDVTDIRRVQQILHRFGDRFPRRYFPRFSASQGEKDWVDATVYAHLWSVKESVFKALGFGYRWTGVLLEWHPPRPPEVELDPERARLRWSPVPHEARWTCSVSAHGHLAFGLVICRWESTLR